MIGTWLTSINTTVIIKNHAHTTLNGIHFVGWVGWDVDKPGIMLLFDENGKCVNSFAMRLEQRYLPDENL